jgi:hypothetical protein
MSPSSVDLDTAVEREIFAKREGKGAKWWIFIRKKGGF